MADGTRRQIEGADPLKDPLQHADTRPMILAITGASGAVYGLTALNRLKSYGIPVHVVISSAGARTLKEETGTSAETLKDIADAVHPVKDIGAKIASGSFLTRGMLIAPCSVKTMSEIATGVTSNLVSRAADVVLKERRRLVLMVRETPFHLGHLRTMTAITEMGGIIAPPLPAFYSNPQSIDEMVRYSVDRALDLFDINADMKRWDGSVR